MHEETSVDLRTDEVRALASQEVSGKTRRDRPCDGCRRRKGRCVPVTGGTQCAACAVHKQPCTYLEEPKPRKRKLEIDETAETVASKKKAHTSSPVGKESEITTSNQSFVQPTMYAPPVFEALSNKAQPGCSQTSFTEHLTYIGPTTEFEPSLITMSSSAQIAPMSGNVRRYGHATFFVDQHTGIDAHGMSLTSTIMEVLEPHISKVADIYRRHIHPCIPILGDDTLGQLLTGNMSAINPLVLGSMYLAALPWHENYSNGGTISPQNKARLEGATSALFSQYLYRPSPCTVVAGLLLMQCPQVDTRVLNTQLVEATHELALHLDCTTWDISDSERALRKRLAWAVYVQDKWCSLIHGRPSTLLGINWSVQSLSDSDWTQSSVLAESPEEKQRRRQLFMQLIKLTQILSAILQTFYSVIAMSEVESVGSAGLRMILERAKKVQVPLKTWFTALQPALRLDVCTSADVSATSTAIGFLHLAYYTTEITLHRSILRTVPSDDPLAEPRLSLIVRTAAKERLVSALEFANRLRPAQLAGFWYFPARVCFALVGAFGALLCATSPGREEALFYKERLKEFRWTLGVAGREAGWLVYAARNLDAQMKALEGLDLEGKPTARELAERREKMRLTDGENGEGKPAQRGPGNNDVVRGEMGEIYEEEDEDEEYDSDEIDRGEVDLLDDDDMAETAV